MNNKIVGAVIGIIAVSLIAAIVVLALRESAPESSTSGNGAMNGMSSEQMQGADKPSSDVKIDDGSVQSGEVEVAIEGFEFAQTEITVKKGTTVTWTNKDEASHDVTADEEKSGAPQSELLGQGESYSFTFNEVGEFGYHCSPHPYMEAKVTVVE